ncbi:hypothetical protein F7Q91_03380 [Vibrio chagasii]|uniref:Bacterial type II secretion system protein E domain-containing protein n=1 Tax=Vibrio chagasii TaxID=170679 RepID=A0A7V7NX55_9VIBR|nr:ATPase, T2SS/T4P/T4SS family [Vibrio chagasii]KAB0482464.1 hypothetical protein F7Q91_03380 [Vibrio chagasii]
MNTQVSVLDNSNTKLVPLNGSDLIETNQNGSLSAYINSPDERPFGIYINATAFTKKSDLTWDIGEIIGSEKILNPAYGKTYLVARNKLSIDGTISEVITLLISSEGAKQYQQIKTSLFSDLSIDSVKGVNLVNVLCVNELICSLSEYTGSKAYAGNDDEGRVFKEISSEIMKLYPSCSDIHFEVSDIPGETKVRIREDGDLKIFKEYPFDFLYETVDIAYNVIGGDKANGSTIQGNNLNWNKPQTGKFIYSFGQSTIEMRVEFAPRTTERGGDLVCRITSGLKETTVRPLADTGYHPRQLRMIKSLSSMKQGNVLLSGVTGSGKTQSLYSIFDYLLDKYAGTRKFVTAENPIEMNLKGVSQVNLEDNSDSSDKRSNTLDGQFDRIAQCFMRLDPDIMGTGEVRCHDSAKFSIEAARTGHLCLSTIHTASAHDVPGRLDGFSIPRAVYQSPSALSIVIAQSLLRTICIHCSKTADELPDDSQLVYKTLKKLSALELVEFLPKIRFPTTGGCEKCDYSPDGRKGRTPVAEVLVPDKTIRAYWCDGEDMKAKAHWYETGGFTKLEHALYKMFLGQLDPEIIESEVDLLENSAHLRKELGVALFNPML